MGAHILELCVRFERVGDMIYFGSQSLVVASHMSIGTIWLCNGSAH